MKNAQIHRFRESVAICLPGMKETLYVDAKTAKKIAKAINSVARSVETVSFADSVNTTHTIDMGKK